MAYLIGFLLASKVVASVFPGVQPKTRNKLLQYTTTRRVQVSIHELQIQQWLTPFIAHNDNTCKSQ